MKSRFILVRVLSGHARLWAAAASGAALYALLTVFGLTEPGTRALLAWNAVAALYMLLVLHMAWGASPALMQRRAVRQGEGRLLVLALVVVAAVAVLVAVGSQLALVKVLQGPAKTPHVMLAALTVLSAWLFTQTLFAVNYAHDFYLARAIGRADVLVFPGTKEPAYGDFFYLACSIGTSGQTSDVAFSGRTLRSVGTLHCVLAFFFNTTVLALAVNIGAGLF
jgi:uncharacterized membrane protein